MHSVAGRNRFFKYFNILHLNFSRFYRFLCTFNFNIVFILVCVVQQAPSYYEKLLNVSCPCARHCLSLQ